MKNKFNLSRKDLREIQRDIARQGRGDWTHLSGQYRAIDIENCLGSNRQGKPSGYGMKQCGCWGLNPAPIAQEQRCQSGYVRLNKCGGFCQGGGSPYAYVCQ